MKRSEYKIKIYKKIKILKSTVIFGWKESMAYSANLWGALWSTLAYIATYLFFLEAIFNRTKVVAGYSQNEILLLTVIIQITFLITFTFSLLNIDELSELIRKGDLDLILIKPLPHLFYVTFKKIDLVGVMLNVVTSVIPVVWMLLKKGGVNLEFNNFIAGSWIMIMGMVAIHGFQFSINMAVFILGKTKNLSRLAMELTNFGGGIPFEGFDNWFRIIGLVLVPCLLPTALATSVMLGKSSGLGWMVLSTMIAIMFLFFKKYLWEEGLKKYQSASS